MEQKRLPIGYYLKLADRALTNGIDTIQSRYGMDRTGWQVLNSIFENPDILEDRLLELMQPFADKSFIESILSKFINEGQIDFKNNRLVLTVEGNKLHGACLESQREFRNKAMMDISEEEYKTTMLTLEKIIANLS